MGVVCEFALRGAGSEPISFSRTVYSHGLAQVAPASVQTDPLVYRRRLRLKKGVVEIALSERSGRLVCETPARLSRADLVTVESAVARMFRLGDDLSPFYARIVADPRLAWAAAGSGRFLASPTVFEDVIKTICTTNCTWAGTLRMTSALVELGQGAFPEPDLLARTPEAWYRDIAKTGYRGAYIQSIAADVAAGALDLEGLLPGRGLNDDTVEERLLELPGIGPYGAAHVMQLLGRHRHLVLDSWTRPKYRRLAGMKSAADSTIRRAFARYGEYAGLAFWLFLTHDWVED